MGDARPRRGECEAKIRPQPPDKAAVIRFADVTAADGHAGRGLLLHHISPLVPGRFASGGVVHGPGQYRHFVPGLGPEAGELVPPRAARVILAQEVLMNQENTHAFPSRYRASESTPARRFTSSGRLQTTARNLPAGVRSMLSVNSTTMSASPVRWPRFFATIRPCAST